MFEVGGDPENGRIVKINNKNAATIITRSRVEYSVTDKRTNKTAQINKSVFDSLLKNNRPKID
jgi:hypothetical protein